MNVGFRRLKNRPLIRVFRSANARRVLIARYGARLPDDDAGREDLFVAMKALAEAGHGEPVLRSQIAIIAPWLPEHEAGHLLDRIYEGGEGSYSGKSIGIALGVTDAERTALRVWNIAPVDVSNDVLAARRVAKKVERRRTTRRKNGMKPQIWSDAHRKPWIACNMSRRSWYRKGKPRPPIGGTVLTPNNLLFPLLGVKVVPLVQPPGRAPSALEVTRYARAGLISVPSLQGLSIRKVFHELQFVETIP